MEEQGEELFEKYHFLLLEAFFHENRDISNIDVLTELARKAGADMEAFSTAFKGGQRLKKVWAEHCLATESYFINAVPAVIIGGRERLIGAVPREAYREKIEKILAQRKGH